MAFKKERGSATIEGAILFPSLFIFLFVLLKLSFFFFSQYNGVDSSAYALRETSHNWYQEKTLYEDFFSDFDFTKTTTRKKEKAEECFKDRSIKALGGSLMGGYTLNNYGVWKTISLDLEGESFYSFEYRFSYPLFTSAGLIRASETGSSIIDDCLEFLGNKSKEKDSEDKTVYIVDTKEKEYDYKQVYHLNKNCFYLRNGYKESLRKKTARERGFRPCRICLGERTGLDE